MKKLFLILFGFMYLFADIFILNSKANIERYKKLQLDIKLYNARLNLLKDYISSQGFSVDIIKEDMIHLLQPEDVLFIIDSFALSKKAQSEIKVFVSEGGVVVFNFKSGFLDENGKITAKSFLGDITDLKQVGYGTSLGTHDLFLIPHLLSPISTSKEAKRLDMVLYDSIPIFSGKTPDMEWTNWGITLPLRYQGKFVPSGNMWDGKFYKGGWIYFSFPFYSFLNAEQVVADRFKYLVNNIIKYSHEGIAIVKWPFLKYDKMVFISEDTEYKFDQFENFIKALQKYDMNGTAFCVGYLAKEYPEIMQNAGELNNLEIASHSYSHTKLTDKTVKELVDIEIDGNNKLLKTLSGQTVRGFRPPREEINKKMLNIIEKSTIKYVLTKNLSQLQPRYRDGLLEFPRLGTDDYGYLVTLDWTKPQIVQRMKEEVDFITGLNGMYTLSTHTHLMNYKSNVTMLEDFLAYLKEKHYPVLKGVDIATLIRKRDNIFIDYTATNTGIEVNLDNENIRRVKEFIFRVYFLRKEIKSASSKDVKVKLITYPYENYVDIKVFNLKPSSQAKIILRY